MLPKRKNKRTYVPAKRSRTWMFAQYLNPRYFAWDTKNRYGDKEIDKYSKRFNDTANSIGYSSNSKYHYIYELYHHYYWTQLNSYRIKWRDYDSMFDIGDPHDSNITRTIAHLVYNHLVMRICYFYYVDSKQNAKSYHRKNTKKRKIGIPKIAGILHNADKSQSGGIVKPHIHIVFRFSKPISVLQLSKWSGTRPQYFESNYKGRYAFENMCAYLIHAKQPLKHLYNPKDVWSNKPYFDYQNYYDNHKGKWASRRYSANHITAKWLEHQVADGKFSRAQILLTPKLYHVYLTDITKINNIMDARADRIGLLTQRALQNGEFVPTVFYVWGLPGVGKTDLVADNLVNKLHKKYNWSVYKGAGSNTFDGYNGQQIVLLDDVRSNSLSASDWLKLLDPLNVNPISARYHNRTVADRVIVITATQNPTQFFGFVKGAVGDEPLGQFLRRLTASIRLIRVRPDTDSDRLARMPKNRRVMISNIRHLTKPIGITINPADTSDKQVHKITNYAVNPYQYMPKSKSYKNCKMFNLNQALKVMATIVAHNNSKSYLEKHRFQNAKTINSERYIVKNNKVNHAYLPENRRNNRIH